MSSSYTYSETFGSYAQLGTKWSQDGFRIVNGKPDYKNCRWGNGGCCYSYYIEPYLNQIGYNLRPNDIHYSCDVAKNSIAVLKNTSNW